MNFRHYGLGSRKAGEVVEVSLSGSSANVKLMDSLNFSAYKAGRKHRYMGGHATKSPVRLAIPRSGNWHVTVDLGGYQGSVKSSIRVLPGVLPEIKERPLSSVPSLVQGNSDSNPFIPNSEEDLREFDVFISHASEDKDQVVRPLALALQSHGLRVWYDEFELRIGDSLRRKIDRGLAKSKFGIVVLSPSFLGKGWTNYELDGIITRAVTGEQVVLPIWHNITKKEVIEFSPSLADKLARSTASHTVEEISSEISDMITGTR
ncbi:DUF1883 domain-containing protein [Paenibacillus alkaliterrae]|uniref:DUF1883 domain-containing protein n=1 Tax=Paenibacillus alkaliterrae TaxID=320909 RepID=UPI001F29D69A|nr:DUF1883 domain-containing protein [Paenibacillus alkaliterrae]MCF2938816.1 DUF1883 domain-containing protein [Paenibacillus alkaliterrae]